MEWNMIKTNSRIESFMIWILLGAISPIMLFLAGWWGSVGLVAENDIFKFAFLGLGVGILTDLIFLKKWAANAFSLNRVVLLFIFLFYSTCIYGFFMGFPVFNAAMGIVAGLYIGRRMYHQNADSEEFNRNVKVTGIFATIVMTVICLSSALLALSETNLPAQLEGMLRLRFEVTWPMIMGLVVLGGTALILSQYWLTRKAASLAFRASVSTYNLLPKKT